MTLPRRRIGTLGPEVSVLALGSWHTYDRMDFHAGVDLIRTAVDAGVNLFDVGVYSGFPLEPGGPVHHGFTDVIFGRLIEQAGVAREDYVLSEKLWLEGFVDDSFAAQLDRALYRVNTHYADFAVLGDPHGEKPDLRRVVIALGELIRDGRLHAWGVNNWSVADIRAVHEFAIQEAVPGPQLAQLKYSLCRRGTAEAAAYRELFAETGISLEASDVLEGGILAGRSGADRMIGRDPGGIRERIKDVAPRAAEVAEELGGTAAQLSIALTLTHPALATVLVGVTRPEQLADNLGALALLERHGADVIREKTAEFRLDRDEDSDQTGEA